MTQVTFGLFDWIDRGETPLHQLYNEALAVLLAGLTHERLTFEGEYYRYHDVPMDLHSLQQPYPPLWYPAHNPESILYAARHGYYFVGLGPLAHVREQLARALEVSDCNYMIGAFAWGTLPHEQALRSLRLFTEEVMPAFAGRTAPLA